MPTRHLRVKFLTNSRRIKNSTKQFDLVLISIWQFLERCSYCSAAYEQRQRNWALRYNEDVEDDDLQDEEPLPLHYMLQLKMDQQKKRINLEYCKMFYQKMEEALRAPSV